MTYVSPVRNAKNAIPTYSNSERDERMIEKSALRKMYLEEYKTITEIAKHYGLSRSGVMYHMKRCNIRKVDRWERYGLKQFSQKQREYLFGALLGDDFLSMGKKRKYPFLAVVHSIKQRKYVEWKYEIWKQIVPGKIRSLPVKVKGRTYFTDRFTTATHPNFLEFFKLFYNEKKVVTREALDKLTPFSIAVWYMDDGSYRRHRGRAQLHTNGFTYKENLLVQRYFKDSWAISCNIGTSDSGTHYIWFNTENTIKFFNIIKDNIQPYFEYKIDRERKLEWKALSKEETEYIRNNYNIKSPRLIAHKLHRPLNTIYGAAHRLRVTQPRGGRKTYDQNL